MKIVKQDLKEYIKTRVAEILEEDLSKKANQPKTELKRDDFLVNPYDTIQKGRVKLLVGDADSTDAAEKIATLKKRLKKEIKQIKETSFQIIKIDKQIAQTLERFLDKMNAKVGKTMGSDPYRTQTVVFNSSDLLGQYLKQNGLLKNCKLGYDATRYYQTFEITNDYFDRNKWKMVEISIG